MGVGGEGRLRVEEGDNPISGAYFGCGVKGGWMGEGLWLRMRGDLGLGGVEIELDCCPLRLSSPYLT